MASNPKSSFTGSQLPTRPLKVERVRQTIVDYVKELVFDGKLKQGERVPQDELAAALKVSNTPVREGMIALEHEGIVTIEHNRGAFVNHLDADRIRDQYALYALLWGWAVERLVARGTPGEAAELLALARKIRRAGDGDEMFRLMLMFSTTVAELAGSSAWRRLVEALPRVVPSFEFYKVVPGAMETAANFAPRMALAVQRKDVPAAVTEIQMMMHDYGEALIAELQRRKLIS
jgi:DNA-binding GntR family transcriptional regulator